MHQSVSVPPPDGWRCFVCTGVCFCTRCSNRRALGRARAPRKATRRVTPPRSHRRRHVSEPESGGGSSGNDKNNDDDAAQSSDSGESSASSTQPPAGVVTRRSLRKRDVEPRTSHVDVRALKRPRSMATPGASTQSQLLSSLLPGSVSSPSALSQQQPLQQQQLQQEQQQQQQQQQVTTSLEPLPAPATVASDGTESWRAYVKSLSQWASEQIMPGAYEPALAFSVRFGCGHDGEAAGQQQPQQQEQVRVQCLRL